MSSIDQRGRQFFSNQCYAGTGSIRGQATICVPCTHEGSSLCLQATTVCGLRVLRLGLSKGLHAGLQRDPSWVTQGTPLQAPENP